MTTRHSPCPNTATSATGSGSRCSSAAGRRRPDTNRPASPRSRQPTRTVMQLLVTGAAGFIGANFVDYWTRHHPVDRVVALDVLTYAGNPANLAPVADRITLTRTDIGDLPAVEALLRERRI